MSINPQSGDENVAAARLTHFEARFAVSIKQFSALRESFMTTQSNILGATERMDAIWADQDPTGVGGWRLGMRAVASFLEANVKQQPPTDQMDRFRGHTEPRSKPQPSSANFPCPRCRQFEVRRLHRHTIFQEALRMVFVAPYRCRACTAKFYRVRF